MASRIVLDLLIRVQPAKRAALIAFLERAVPFYEEPGGIRVSLLADRADPSRMIERVEYKDAAAFDADQRRVSEDPRMKTLLEEWRSLLNGPSEVQVYQEIPLDRSADATQ